MSKHNYTVKNGERDRVIVSIVLLLLAVTFMCSPFVLRLDMMQWGYGIFFLGLFFTLSMGVITGIFLWRYNLVRAMLQEEDILARWEYSPEVHLGAAYERYCQRKKENFAKLAIATFFFILFAILFSVMGMLTGEGEYMPTFVIIMLGIWTFISMVAVGMPIVYFYRERHTEPVTYFSRNGVYHYGQLYIWKKPFAQLDSVQFTPDKKSVQFRIRSFALLGYFQYVPYVLTIPVPDGKQKNAQLVIDEVGSSK